MKNIHVLPTDKPSRLHLIEDVLMFTNEYKNSVCDSEVNIYITSDEEIKEGDWYHYFGHIIKYDSDENTLTSNCKKIILTTDQDLIKDGVQDIDTEFLEWFVKNPSCEEVTVYDGLFENRIWKKYIIIPKEKQKQHLIDIMKKTPMTFVPDEKMYSEEDMIAFMRFIISQESLGNTSSVSVTTAKYYLEQFKKK